MTISQSSGTTMQYFFFAGEDGVDADHVGEGVEQIGRVDVDGSSHEFPLSAMEVCRNKASARSASPAGTKRWSW